MITIDNKNTKTINVSHIEVNYPTDLFTDINNNDFTELQILDKDEVIEQLTQLLIAEQNNVLLLQQRISEILSNQ